MDRTTLILILLGILVILVVIIALALRIRRKKKIQEEIPGVEEMAKTAFFWSDYHEGKIGEDEKV